MKYERESQDEPLGFADVLRAGPFAESESQIHLRTQLASMRVRSNFSAHVTDFNAMLIKVPKMEWTLISSRMQPSCRCRTGPLTSTTSTVL